MKIGFLPASFKSVDLRNQLLDPPSISLSDN